MLALDVIPQRNSHRHALIIGGDGMSDGQRPNDGKNWREKMLREVGLDPERPHFLRRGPCGTDKQVLDVS